MEPQEALAPDRAMDVVEGRVDQLRGAIDLRPNPPAPFTKRTTATLADRIVSLDPLFSDDIESTWDARGAYTAEVCFCPANRFALPDEVRDASDAVTAVIIECHDEVGNMVDLAAWRPDCGKPALWRGAVAMLGQEHVFAPRLDEPLRVFRTVPDWLRADREGVVVIDERRAARLLDGITLAVDRDEIAFGQSLRDELTIAPQIVVARGLA